MSLVVEIPNNTIAKNGKSIKLLNKNLFFNKDFLINLRASVADAEDPERAFNDILEALEEAYLADSGQMQLQSAREFMREFDKK